MHFFILFLLEPFYYSRWLVGCGGGGGGRIPAQLPPRKKLREREGLGRGSLAQRNVDREGGPEKWHSILLPFLSIYLDVPPRAYVVAACPP